MTYANRVLAIDQYIYSPGQVIVTLRRTMTLGTNRQKTANSVKTF